MILRPAENIATGDILINGGNRWDVYDTGMNREREITLLLRRQADRLTTEYGELKVRRGDLLQVA
jgi:hypothetical protein